MDLESTTRFESGGVVKHLKDEWATSTHLDLTDIEAKAEECFEERALSIRLAPNGDDFRDRESLSEGNGGSLEAVVSLEARFGI